VLDVPKWTPIKSMPEALASPTETMAECKKLLAVCLLLVVVLCFALLFFGL
jgi:hypothetical protein